MLPDLNPGFEFWRCRQRTRDQTQRLGFVQKTDCLAPAVFTGNCQVRTDNDLLEVIAGIRLAHCSLRFHSQIRVLEFRSRSNDIEGSCKTTGKRSHQKLFGCPPTLETAKLRCRAEVYGVRSRLRLGDPGALRAPPGYNATLVFIFRLVLTACSEYLVHPGSSLF